MVHIIPDVTIIIDRHYTDEDYKSSVGFYLPPDIIGITNGMIRRNTYYVDESGDWCQVENEIDLIINFINHEYMHHIIYHLEGEEACEKFDNLDLYSIIELEDVK